MKPKLILIVFLMVCSMSFSQNANPGKVWFQEYFTLRKGNGIFTADIGVRSSDWFSNFNQYLIRAGGGYRFNDKWKMLAMGGYFYTNQSAGASNEIRLHLDVDYLTNIFSSRVVFEWRFRNEYRLIKDPVTLNNNWRIRNRFSLLVPINKPNIEKNTWYFQFDEEVFFELGKNVKRFLDKNRLSATFGYALTLGIRFELNYTYEIGWSNSADAYQNNHIMWVRFRQTLFLTKKSKPKKQK